MVASTKHAFCHMWTHTNGFTVLKCMTSSLYHQFTVLFVKATPQGLLLHARHLLQWLTNSSLLDDEKHPSLKSPQMEQSYEATIPWGNNIKRALKRRPCKTDWSLTMAVMHTAGSTEDTKSCMHHNIVTTLPAWRLLLHSKQPSHKLKVTQLLLVFF